MCGRSAGRSGTAAPDPGQPCWSLRGRQLASGFGELADQPIRLQRIVEPWLGPATVEADLNHLGRDRLAVEIEQRQLAARLGESSPQVEQLRQRRLDLADIVVVQRAKRDGRRKGLFLISKHGVVPLDVA